MTRYFRDQKGFTLIEMIIVVIIMGILAAVIIPHISMSTEDAKLNTLKTNLSSLRSSIDVYYAQHNQNYPGAVKTNGSGAATVAGDLPAAFVDQLTLYTMASGQAKAKKSDLTDPTKALGPYVKLPFPENPFNSKNDVVCDIAETDITKRDSKAADNAWKFYVKTGVLIPADGTTGDHDTL